MPVFSQKKKITKGKKKRKKLKCVFSTSKENLINNWIRKYSFKDDLVQGNFVVCYMHNRRKHSVKKAMLRQFFLFFIFLQLHWLISLFTSFPVISNHKNREMQHDAWWKQFPENLGIMWRCTAYMCTVLQFNAGSGQTKRAEIYILPVALWGYKCQKDHGRVIFLTNQSFLNISCS